jgi:hypothetical protein
MACCTPGSSPRWQVERQLAPVGAQMNVMYVVAVALIGAPAPITTPPTTRCPSKTSSPPAWW